MAKNQLINNQQQISDIDTKIEVLKTVFESNRIAYNTKVFQVDTKNTINPKGIKIIEKGLGLKLFCIELVNNNMRLTFDIVNKEID